LVSKINKASETTNKTLQLAITAKARKKNLSK